MAIPSIVGDALGDFPHGWESIAEDMYLCCAARQRGYEVRCLSVSGYRHMQGQSFGGNRATEGKLVTTLPASKAQRAKQDLLPLIFHSRNMVAPTTCFACCSPDWERVNTLRHSTGPSPAKKSI